MNQASWNIGFGTKWMIETLKDVGKGSSKSISKKSRARGDLKQFGELTMPGLECSLKQ